MASSIHILVVVAFVAAVVAPVFAKDIVVGDDNGWTNNNFDYQAWAATKQFYVGDKLVFKYPKGVHNVHKADLAHFQNCTKPAESDGFATGNDVITLASAGKKWYLCSVASHCATGKQKLAITVLEKMGSPAASSTPSTSPSSTYIVMVAAMPMLFKMMVV